MTIIRAAISVNEDTNESIRTQSIKLYKEVLKNNPDAEIKALIASQTKDLKSYNCCTAIRENFKTDFALECFQEAEINGQMEKVIRFTILCENEFDARFVYMEKAAQLRADLFTNSETSN